MSRFGECAALATIGIAGVRATLAGQDPSSLRAREARAQLADASYWRGFALMRLGDVRAALKDLGVAAGHPGPQRAAALAASIECHVALGQTRPAEELAPALRRLAQDPWAQWGLADLAEASGDHEAAADTFARVGARIDEDPRSNALIPWRAAQALALTRLGHRHEATILAREALRRARAHGAPYAHAQALRCLAAVDPTSDRPYLLRTALGVLHDVKALRLEAQLSTDLAGVLALAPGPHAKREVPDLLRRSEQIAVQLHLQPLRERIRRLQLVIGPELAPPAAASPLLTISERRVADLAASGMSNRQIAAHLVVTVKAIEWHLSNVYRKLGITGRTRLAAALMRLPASPSSALVAAVSSVAHADPTAVLPVSPPRPRPAH